jgi:ATP-dependent Clp protease ATP-binding subunit ClpA
MTVFTSYLPRIIDRGSREAQQDGSSTVEAHHLLLAIVADLEPTTHAVLADAGLDYRGLRDALHREYEASLGAAGVSLAAFDLPKSPVTKTPRPGNSMKLALERGLGTVARKRDLRPAHVLLGILQAPVGTMPRALALAGVDQGELTRRVQGSLSPEPTASEHRRNEERSGRGGEPL